MLAAALLRAPAGGCDGGSKHRLRLNAQAAKVLGCTTAGFAVRLHRARRRFEAALAATDPIPLLTPVTEAAS